MLHKIMVFGVLFFLELFFVLKWNSLCSIYSTLNKIIMKRNNDMVFSESVPANIAYTMATLRCAIARFDKVYGIIILSNLSMTIFQMSS